MTAFVDERRGAYGAGPVCRVLPIAPSTYRGHVARRADPSRVPACAQRDAGLQGEIRRAFEEDLCVYGVRKVLRREGVPVARRTAARLMRGMGLAGVVRGKPVRTTVSDKAAPCPLDRAGRQFRAPAPNMPWVSDFTYVGTWPGFAYAASAVEPRGSPDIDAFARRVVGWRVSCSAHAGFVLDAPEQALHERRPAGGELVHHSGRGSQHVCIKYSERLAEAGVEPSVGSVGGSYDDALAETVNGLYKAEVVRRRGPWRSLEAVEAATLEWAGWFNNRRLLEPVGNIPPAEADANCYATPDDTPMAA